MTFDDRIGGPGELPGRPESSNCGRAVASHGGYMSEGGEDVGLREGRGVVWRMRFASACDGPCRSSWNKRRSISTDALLSVEDLGFVFFPIPAWLKRSAVDQSLLALVVGGNQMEVGLRHFPGK